jgi:hypothetical protein
MQRADLELIGDFDRQARRDAAAVLVGRLAGKGQKGDPGGENAFLDQGKRALLQDARVG